MKKFINVILALIIFALPLSACNSTKSNLTTVRVNEVTHSIFYAPFYVAIENGYFEEENIQIELTNGGGADKSMTALLSNSADVGLMGPEAAMYVYLNGRENYPQIFGQLTKRDGSFLISRNKEENFDYSNLVGKEIIAGRKGGVPALTLEYMLKQKGLIDGQNITLNYDIQFNLTAAAFEGGTGDYCTLFEPTASEFEKAQKGYVVASIGKDSGEIPYTAFMATKEYILNNEKTIKAFLRAVYKGINFVNEASEEELANALKGQFPSTSDESIVLSVRRYIECDAWKKNMTMLEEDYNLLQTVIESAGELETRVPFEHLVINTYANEIYLKMLGNN
ncbi:MAG: ABC transporter substrate-binding protein [Clostridia bacterium]|nr:ABC transporter substrate-binding protein [Clostridia bacterium]